MKNPILKFFKKHYVHKQPTFLTREGNEIFIQMNVPHSNPAILFATIEDDYIHIYDFKTKIKGAGYGTKMMECLINYANNNSIKYIDGEIIEADIKETKYLIDFYRKFGFKILDPIEQDYKFYIKLIL